MGPIRVTNISTVHYVEGNLLRIYLPPSAVHGCYISMSRYWLTTTNKGGTNFIC